MSKITERDIWDALEIEREALMAEMEDEIEADLEREYEAIVNDESGSAEAHDARVDQFLQYVDHEREHRLMKADRYLRDLMEREHGRRVERLLEEQEED